MRANHIRITVSITDDLTEQFTELTRQIGVSGTALISRTLPAELDYLAKIPGNSRRARKALEMVSDPEMGRINFTLSRQDAERMDAICKEKNVPRNSFLRTYIDFLCNGEPDVCAGPLTLVNKILADPRYEYEQNKQALTIADNPYSLLHLAEETVAEVVKIMRS